MDRITDFVPTSLVPSTTLNAMQDRAHGVRPLDAELMARWASRSVQGLIAQFAALAIGPTSAVQLDQTALPQMDWRRHLVEGWIADLTAGGPGQYLGGADERGINFEMRKARHFCGFLGNGSSLAFGAADCYVQVDYEPLTPVVAKFYLYADPVDGRLMLYNVTGGARLAMIRVQSLGRIT